MLGDGEPGSWRDVLLCRAWWSTRWVWRRTMRRESGRREPPPVLVGAGAALWGVERCRRESQVGPGTPRGVHPKDAPHLWVAAAPPARLVGGDGEARVGQGQPSSASPGLAGFSSVDMLGVW